MLRAASTSSAGSITAQPTSRSESGVTWPTATFDASGDLLVTGTIDSALAVWKISTADGTLDPSFGTDGVFKFEPTIGTLYAQGYDIVSFGDEIWVAGETSSADGNFTAGLWKLTLDGRLDTDFQGGSSTVPGLFMVDNAGGWASTRALVRVSDGVIIAGQVTPVASAYSNVGIWKIR